MVASSNVGLVVCTTKGLAGHTHVKYFKRKLVRKTSLIVKELFPSLLRDYQFMSHADLISNAPVKVNPDPPHPGI